MVWGCEGKGQTAADRFFAELDPEPAASPSPPPEDAPRSEHAKAPRQPPEPAIMVPFGPCPTVPAGEGIPGAWLAPGSELAPAIAARASKLTAVSMDMTGGYAASVRDHAPQATIVIDNYHVVQLATKALDEVRREHWNELRRTGEQHAAKAFKDARWSLLKNPDDLTDQQADTLKALKAAGGKVARAWTMKEMVRAIFAPGLTVEAVAELLDRLLARLSRSRLKPFVRLGRTIRKHREGILAARRLKLSNARAEALNNMLLPVSRIPVIDRPVIEHGLLDGCQEMVKQRTLVFADGCPFASAIRVALSSPAAIARSFSASSSRAAMSLGSSAIVPSTATTAARKRSWYSARAFAWSLSISSWRFS